MSLSPSEIVVFETREKARFLNDDFPRLELFTWKYSVYNIHSFLFFAFVFSYLAKITNVDIAAVCATLIKNIGIFYWTYQVW